MTLTFTLQALGDVHLYSAGIVDGARNTNVESIPQGNPMYVGVFSLVAIFSLMIAGINYTNLTTARASSRIKEIGVRKVIGAVQSSVTWQFLTESLLTTIIAFILAMLIVVMVLPLYSQFVNKQLFNICGESTCEGDWCS